MRIAFLMPCYSWAPSGGFRVVYEYASRLAAMGHQVSVIHPRKLHFAPPDSANIRMVIRNLVRYVKEAVTTPKVGWQAIDNRVRLLYVPTSEPRYIPEGDIIFATAWHTVASVLKCPTTKGMKAYLIQGYESWQGPKVLVDETWRLPIPKIVVSKWLEDVGKSLGAVGLTYIPNGVDCERYKPAHPLTGRKKHVAMMYSATPGKGSSDGLAALKMAKHEHADLKAMLFGVSRRPKGLPEWITYQRNPSQDFIVNSIYSRAAVFVSPSWTEGFALPAAEALACGCALVATDSGGIRDFTDNGQTGLLSEPKKPEALAQNISLLLRDENLRVRLAMRGNLRIRDFSWEKSSQSLDQFITMVSKSQKS